jgi:hypothetical protein
MDLRAGRNQPGRHHLAGRHTLVASGSTTGGPRSQARPGNPGGGPGNRAAAGQRLPGPGPVAQQVPGGVGIQTERIRPVQRRSAIQKG